MKILIVAATGFEIAPLRLNLEEHYQKIEEYRYKNEKAEITLLITGVGLTATAFALGRILNTSSFDLILNIGVAGAFHNDLRIGEVVEVVSEQFGDLGVEEKNGKFTDVFEMGLSDGAVYPFVDHKMINPYIEFNLLKKVKGLTVNKVHGYKNSIEAIKNKYHVDVESMEGAAFFYSCLLSEVKFLEIRAISNYVEPRNRDNWDLPLAIENLNQTVWGLLNALK
jgi:futalosine hydrolase